MTRLSWTGSLITPTAVRQSNCPMVERSAPAPRMRLEGFADLLPTEPRGDAATQTLTSLSMRRSTLQEGRPTTWTRTCGRGEETWRWEARKDTHSAGLQTLPDNLEIYTFNQSIDVKN